MVNVAIVEDDDTAAELLYGYLHTFEKNSGVRFSIKRFPEAVSFLSEYRSLYDVIFMDIEMPNISGMEAALKLREFDKQAVLIFVTNMAQFAVKGYEANALDFMIKPVTYSDFSQKIQKALSVIDTNANVELVVARADGFMRVSIKKISYIEVMSHKLLYHTDEETITATGSLTELEEKLKPYSFMRCNSCYLINPKYIRSVQGHNVHMQNGDSLKISHPKRKKFMSELADWLGQGNFI